LGWNVGVTMVWRMLWLCFIINLSWFIMDLFDIVVECKMCSVEV